MITRDDVQNFANTYTSFFNNNNTRALEAEACFIFETGLDRELSHTDILWLQTYMPSDPTARRDLCEQRRRAHSYVRPDV